jgi:insertion element IS1 protein InsB
LTRGDCWIGLSLDQQSGLILSARVGKHTDTFLAQLGANTEGKTDCKLGYTDDWGGDERVFTAEIVHIIGKENTLRLERTNGIIRQQTGKWHRRQSKFGKLWEQAKVTTLLVISDFNWLWRHSRSRDTAAERAGLATRPWGWNDLATFPTFY